MLFYITFYAEIIRARTRARSAAHDFHAVILGLVCCYKTDIGFTINFILIYAILDHILRWNPPDHVLVLARADSSVKRELKQRK